MMLYEKQFNRIQYTHLCCGIPAAATSPLVAFFVDNQTKPFYEPWPPQIPDGRTSQSLASLLLPHPARTRL